MIINISLMSRRSYEAALVDGNMDGPIEDLHEKYKPFRQHLDEKYFGALVEYEWAIEEGYVVTERYPFAKGEGINLVMCKPKQAITPENAAKAGPPPDWSK